MSWIGNFFSSHAFQGSLGTISAVVITHIIARRDRDRKARDRKRDARVIHDKIENVEQLANGQLERCQRRVNKLEDMLNERFWAGWNQHGDPKARDELDDGD